MSMEDYSLYAGDAPTLTGVERELFEGVTREEPWALVEQFAELDRVDGTADQRTAAQYLRHRLESLGIDHEWFEPEIRSTLPRDAAVRVTEPTEAAFTDDGRPDAVKPELFSRSGRARGELVYLEDADPDGIEAVPKDVEGRIVVVESLPVSIDAKIALEAAGAAGIIAVHPHEDTASYGRLSSRFWGAIPPVDENDESTAVAVAVSNRIGSRLVALARAAERAVVEISAELDTDWRACPLVLARIEGEAAPAVDDFVLLHAHYDSWYAGVTDNATGDGGILECARVLDEYRESLRRDLWIAWWPGHSQASYAGSAWFADEFALELHDRCVAHVNMDGPGGADATEFDTRPSWMPEADGLCRRAIRDVAGKAGKGGRPSRAGDYSFNNLGLSGLFMGVSNVPSEVAAERGWDFYKDPAVYHVPSDTIEKADPDVLVRDIRVFVVVLYRLLASEVLPLDHRDTLQRHRRTIKEYDRAAGDHFDLEPVLEALEKLAATLEELHAGAQSGSLSPKRVNEAIKQLSRELVSLDFASRGRFDQDPTLKRPAYPRLHPILDLPHLEGDAKRIRTANLKRRRSHVVARLRRAAATVADVVEGD